MTRSLDLGKGNGVRLWLRVAIVAVAVLIVEAALLLVSLPFATSVFPYLTSGPAGFDPGTQLAYGQLVAGFAAVALAGGLGLVAVEQLIAGRQAVEQGQQGLLEDRLARATAAQAQTQRVLDALMLELGNNRSAALMLEGQLAADPSQSYRVSLGFSRGIFDGLITGPIWTLSDIEQLWPTIAAAYTETFRLSQAVRPVRFLPYTLAGVLVAAFSQGQNRQRSIVIFGGVFALLAIAGTHSDLLVSGVATAARVAVEKAMEAIYPLLHDGMAIPWTEYDEHPPAGYRRLQPRDPGPVEQLLAWVGRWLGDELRV